MTVISANEIDMTASEDDDGHSTYTVTYRIICDNATDGVRTCFLSGFLPAYPDSYIFFGESNLFAFYKNYSNFRYEDLEHRLTRLIDITYTTRPQWTKSPSEFGDPLSEPWKVSVGFTDLTKLTGVDQDGAAIMNSSDELKIREIPDGNSVYRLRGYTPTIDTDQQSDAVKHVNSTTFWGKAPRTLLMRIWEVDHLYHGTNQIIYNAMEIEYKKAGWNEVFVDMGTRTKLVVGTRHIYTEFLDTQDHKTRLEQHLDGSGQPNDWTANPDGVQLTVEAIPEYDFNSIPGIPNPLPSAFI